MKPTTKVRPSCPFCDPNNIGFPELIPSGRASPKDYMCPLGSSCKGIEDRPDDFNYFTTDGKPIPYEEPKDGKAGYSPQPGRKFSTSNNPWVNDPSNTPNLDSFEYEMTNDTKKWYIRYYLNKWRTWEKNYVIYRIAEILDIKPGLVRAEADQSEEQIYYVE